MNFFTRVGKSIEALLPGSTLRAWTDAFLQGEPHQFNDQAVLLLKTLRAHLEKLDFCMFLTANREGSCRYVAQNHTTQGKPNSFYKPCAGVVMSLLVIGVVRALLQCSRAAVRAQEIHRLAVIRAEEIKQLASMLHKVDCVRVGLRADSCPVCLKMFRVATYIPVPAEGAQDHDRVCIATCKHTVHLTCILAQANVLNCPVCVISQAGGVKADIECRLATLKAKHPSWAQRIPPSTCSGSLQKTFLANLDFQPKAQGGEPKADAETSTDESNGEESSPAEESDTAEESKAAGSVDQTTIPADF
jgi:hypothetical protein